MRNRIYEKVLIEFGKHKKLARIIAIIMCLLLVLPGSNVTAFAMSIKEAENVTVQETSELPEETSEDDVTGETVEVSEKSDEPTEFDLIDSDVAEEISENEKENIEETDLDEEAALEEVSVTMPELSDMRTVDGVVITVTAPEGVFPEGATLSVLKVEKEEQQDVDSAVDKARDENVNVAASYTYDIKVLDKDGNEIQPADGQKVNVSFTLEEAENENLTADVYHITEENGELSAEALDITEEGQAVIAESDGFSYYTVEFTYDEKQYVMQGDSSVALTDILSFVGITKADGNTVADSDITAVSVSNESLFSASNEGGEWTVTAHQAFTSEEWMKVTVDGVEYEIVVTDATYSSTVDGTALSVGDIIKKGCQVTNVQTVSLDNDYNWIFTGPWVDYGYRAGTWTADNDYRVTSVGENYGYGQNPIVTAMTVNPTYTAPTAKTMTYNGSSQTLVTAGSVSAGGTMEYALGEDDGTAPTSGWSETVPSETNKGTYYVWWRINQTSGYYAVTASCLTSSINQATNSWTTSAVKQDDWTFNDTSKALLKTVPVAAYGSITYRYKKDNGSYSSYSSTVPSAENAGTYTVEYKVDSTTNYTALSGSVSVTVSKAANPLKYNDIQSATGTYSNTSQMLMLSSASNNQGTLSYAINSQKNSSNTAVEYFSLSGSNLTVAANTPAGTYTVVVRATAAGNDNYNSGTKDSTVTVTINKKDITVSGITAGNKVYDRSTAATLDTSGASFNGLLSGDALTVSAIGTFNDMNVGTGKTVTISNLTLGGTSAGNYKLASSGQQTTTTANITAKALTVTADDKTKIYGTADPALTYTYDGLINGDSFTGELSREDGSDVGTYSIKQGTLTAGDNYNIAYTSAEFKITKATPNITGLAAKDLTYNKTEQALVTSGTASGGTLLYAMTEKGAAAPSDDDYNEVVPNVMHAGTYTVYYKVAGNNNYEDVDVSSLDVTIKKKDITISGIKANDKTYDAGTAAELDYSDVTYSGIVEGDSLTVTATGTFTDAKATADDKTVNITGITLGGDSINDYQLAASDQQTTATAKINKKVVGIDWGTNSFTFNGKNQAPTATATGLAEGDICTVTVSGEQTNVGNYTATASALSNNNYTLPNDTSITEKAFTISPKAVTDSDIVFGNDTGLEAGNYTYTGSRITPTIAVTSLLEGDEDVTTLVKDTDYTVSRDTSAIAVGPHTVRFDFKGNYSGTLYGTWEIVPQTITITADDMSKIYGESDPDEFTFSVSPSTADVEGINFTLSRAEGENAGTYAINVTGPDTIDGCNVTYVPGTFTINKANVTVKAANKSKIYGDGNPELTASVSGLKNNDAESVIVYNLSCDAVKDSNAGIYAITPSGDAVQGNYNVNYVDGTLTVSKRRLSNTPFVLNNVSFSWDGNDHSPTPVFKGEGYTCIAGTDFEISGETTANDKGKHTITLRGIGDNFTGNISLDWYITSVGDTRVTYNGQEQSLAYEPEEGVSVTFLQDDGETWTATPPSYKDAGTYEIEYKTTVENPMYPDYSTEPTLDVEGTAVLTIEPKELTVTADNKSKIFGKDDPELTFTVEGIVEGETKDDVFTNTTLSREAGEDVGEYDILQGSLAVNSNYTIAFTKGKLTISKEALTGGIFTVKIKSGTTETTKIELVEKESGEEIEVPYGSAGWTAEVTSTATGVGDVTVKYYKVNEETGELDELTTGVPTELGEYVVKLSVSEGTNYAGTGDTPLGNDAWKFKIVKAAFPSDLGDDYWPTVNNGTNDEGLKYTGSNQNLLIAPVQTTAPEGYTLKYSTDGENWSETIPQGRNSGEYTVYAKYVSNDPTHFEDSEVKTYTVAIAAAENINEKPDETLFEAVYVSAENATDGEIKFTDLASSSGSEPNPGTDYTKFEYSTDNGENWNDITDTMSSISPLGKGEVLIRTKETGTGTEEVKAASEPITLSIGVKEDQTAPSADSFTVTKASSDTAADGVISGVDDTMEYSTDGGNTWTSVEKGKTSITGLLGGTTDTPATVKIRKKGTNTNNPSPAVDVTIGVKTNQNPPTDVFTFTATKASDNTSDDGTIIISDEQESGTDTGTLEYSDDNGDTWTPVASGATKIEGLPAGDVKIRYAGTDDKNPSEPVIVTIGTKNANSHEAGPALTDLTVTKATDDETADGTITISDYDGTGDETDKLEYSTDGGTTWTTVPDGTNPISVKAGDVLIRYKGDDDTNPSPSTTVTVGTKTNQAAPDSDKLTVAKTSGKGKSDGSISGVDDTMEYSTDGGHTWTKVPAGKKTISGLPVGEVQIRYAGTNEKNAGEVLKVSVEAKNEEVKPPVSSGTVQSKGIYVEQDYPSIVAGLVYEKSNAADDVEFRWIACETGNPKAWFEVSPWTKNNEWLNWTPDRAGNYVMVCQARVVGNENSLISEAAGVVYKIIKNTCQVPYTGEGGGYLIGFETKGNPNQSYQYEVLILDCTLYAQGKDAWIYSTGKCGLSEGNTFWTIWQPKYGYYWTLFRVYDEHGNLLDEECYGFANVY